MNDTIRPAPPIQGRVCIHTTAFSDKICGKPVPVNRPNGWLCQWHAQAVLHGEGVLMLQRNEVPSVRE